ncbi:MAG: hypothetical protein AAGN35_02525 [Bacteroidota bacterium]
MSEKIMTLHPEGKAGVNIDAQKYQTMRGTILELLTLHQPIGFSDLMKLIEGELSGNFDGSIAWYYTTVKLDLEARGAVRRIKKSGKQMLELVGESTTPH